MKEVKDNENASIEPTVKAGSCHVGFTFGRCTPIMLVNVDFLGQVCRYLFFNQKKALSWNNSKHVFSPAP